MVSCNYKGKKVEESFRHRQQFQSDAETVSKEKSIGEVREIRGRKTKWRLVKIVQIQLSEMDSCPVIP